MSVTFQIEGISEAIDNMMASIPSLTQSGVKVEGPAAAYALVWEWGSATLQQPGPKTLWSTNPAGEMAILTLTAPFGYIRVNRDKYRQILREEFSKINWAEAPMDTWFALADAMMQEVAIRCAILISDTAPIDTGDLRASIIPVAPGEVILVDGTSTSYGPTEFDLANDWA